MNLRILTAVLFFAGCKAIPLNDDPTIPFRDAHVSFPAIYEVAWTTPLVKLGLLEYQPIEPASPAIDPDGRRESPQAPGGSSSGHHHRRSCRNA